MKTIGVLGGLGPQATMDFEARVHAVAQQAIPQFYGSGYPRLMVYYHRHTPMLVSPDGQPIAPLQPHPKVLQAPRALGSLADSLVMPSNTPHRFHISIEQAAGRPPLIMVNLVVDEVVRPSI
jgi:aspartate racemase